MQKFKLVLLAIAWSGAVFSAGYLLALGKAPQTAQNLGKSTIELIPEPAAQDASSTGREINKMAADLSQVNQEIARLEAMNNILATQIEQLKLPLPQSITYEQLMSRIDRLPASFINKLLANLIDEEYLANIENPNAFAKELVEVALEDEEIEDVSGVVSIDFSFSPIYGLRQFSYVSELQQFDRIFAHIFATQDMPDCIIRWKHQATGEILLFKQQALVSSGQSQSISVKPSQGWRTGNYKVSVYDMSDNKRLVGTNNFSVVSIHPDEFVSAEDVPDMDVIQDLISTGEAISKSY